VPTNSEKPRDAQYIIYATERKLSKNREWSAEKDEAWRGVCEQGPTSAYRKGG